MCEFRTVSSYTNRSDMSCALPISHSHPITSYWCFSNLTSLLSYPIVIYAGVLAQKLTSTKISPRDLGILCRDLHALGCQEPVITDDILSSKKPYREDPL